MAKRHEIELQRVYDAIRADAGYRVLVDRLWPRGVSKADLALDEWLPNRAATSVTVSPSLITANTA